MIASAPNREALDREHLLERLHELRTTIPALTKELASARRQTAALRVERRKLLERVARLQRERGAPR
jgi:chromosome segregation ATPase